MFIPQRPITEGIIFQNIIMKKLCYFAIVLLIGTSCTKNSTKSTDIEYLTKSNLSKLSDNAGAIHSYLIDQVGKTNNLALLTKEQYRYAIYSIKMEGVELNYFDTKLAIDKRGIYDFKNYITNHFAYKSEYEQDILKQIVSITISSQDFNEINKQFNKLKSEILSKSFTATKQLCLLGALEIARSSSKYWLDAKQNQLNPYHQFFENYQKPYFPDCVTIIDICMFAISYDEYLENGYNPTQAETAAAQDAAYQSGLAGMAGGACV